MNVRLGWTIMAYKDSIDPDGTERYISAGVRIVIGDKEQVGETTGVELADIDGIGQVA